MMNRIFFVLNLFLLSSCITYNEANHPEDYAYRDYVLETKERERKDESINDVEKPKKENIKYVTKEKVVKVSTGCRPMKMPALRGVPALPKAAVLKAQAVGHVEMDRVLMQHIAQLRNVISSNNAAVKRAVQAQNATCVK